MPQDIHLIPHNIDPVTIRIERYHGAAGLELKKACRSTPSIIRRLAPILPFGIGPTAEIPAQPGRVPHPHDDDAPLKSLRLVVVEYAWDGNHHALTEKSFAGGCHRFVGADQREYEISTS